MLDYSLKTVKSKGERTEGVFNGGEINVFTLAIFLTDTHLENQSIEIDNFYLTSSFFFLYRYAPFENVNTILLISWYVTFETHVFMYFSFFFKEKKKGDSSK